MRIARQFLTSSPEETIAVGRELAAIVHSGQMIVLRGKLGAGKTILVKGIAEAFRAAPQENVTSPTFNLVHEYRGLDITIFHIDLYRIDTGRELMTLALDDLRAEPGSLLLVEWGEKFDQVKSQSDGEIEIEVLGEAQRRVSVRI